MDTLMHELELVAIWFSSVIIGGLLMMLLPTMVSVPTRSGCIDDRGKAQPAQDESNEQSEAVVSIQTAHDVYVVSTSWAWGLPRAASAPDALSPDRAHRMVPSSGQQACAIGMGRKAAGRRGEEREEGHRELVMHQE